MESLVADPANLMQIAEGKTKIVFQIKGHDDFVLIRSKDQITAFNAARKNDLKGKGRFANKTTANVFKLLNSIGKLAFSYVQANRMKGWNGTVAGLATHFVAEAGDNEFVAKRCEMIPIEWVARRIATGSFLRRNPGVQQGYRFKQLKMETFFKYSDEQIECANFEFNGLKIGKAEINQMKNMTSVIFKVLEKCWNKHNCVLIDMKVEFGVSTDGQILLADVIDNDSWRVWPHGDRRLQLDKQFYRDMKEVTSEALQELISNYEKVMELTAGFCSTTPLCRAMIIMGSPSDRDHCERISASCKLLGIASILRISSAHKATHETLEILSEYENDGFPMVIIAVAGRSNGLGPVLAGNSTLPVINCPPVNENNMMLDIWSSVRMPSGIGCSTVFGAEEAALCAAKILASHDYMVFGKILCQQLNNLVKLQNADKAI
ncbi:unnamed protein product [Angiostrongylus costaricensis]|uniref:AIRC domain-containing protein n=1 Tax=Angiostrongylus costaricensis TaxID=334426 RepID=A0A0R3PYH7_ANGCS|nr:unnamed protein product [Angiostrongylus costaricensis]